MLNKFVLLCLDIYYNLPNFVYMYISLRKYITYISLHQQLFRKNMAVISFHVLLIDTSVSLFLMGGKWYVYYN